MRICDVCMNPDPFKRKAAVVRVSIERLHDVSPEDLKKIKNYRGWDSCLECLPEPIRKEVTTS